MDEVETLSADPDWRGSWPLDPNADAHLDLHQLAFSGGEVFTARATATMGHPAESNYAFRPVAWHSVGEETTAVDLVFEPRIGEPSLQSAQSIAGTDSAAGVTLITAAGRRITLYWSPDGEICEFADGTRLDGGVAVEIDNQVYGCGTTELQRNTSTVSFSNAIQCGLLVAIDHQQCTIEVKGLCNIATGDRIVLNPQGRGRNYLVETVEKLACGHHRLHLDVTSLLGRNQALTATGHTIELDYHLIARTGYLHGARLQRVDGTWAEIAEAHNLDSGRTTVELHEVLPGIKPGEWLEIVDCVAGDEVLFEPNSHGHAIKDENGGRI